MPNVKLETRVGNGRRAQARRRADRPAPAPPAPPRASGDAETGHFDRPLNEISLLEIALGSVGIGIERREAR